MAVGAPAPRDLWRRQLSGGGRCGDERPVLISEPHTLTGSGGTAASAMVVSTVDHAPCWLIFPPARASGGPEIF
eukprot:222400-Prymnesium_polylepis.1